MVPMPFGLFFWEGGPPRKRPLGGPRVNPMGPTSEPMSSLLIQDFKGIAKGSGDPSTNPFARTVDEGLASQWTC